MRVLLYRYISKPGLLLMACLLVITITSKAQNLDSLARIQSDSISLSNQRSVEVIGDSTQQKIVYPFLSDISFILDYGKLIAILSEFESKGELGVELGIKKSFFFNLEYGTSVLTPVNAYTNTNYRSEGNYARIGLGFKRNMSAKTTMGLSVRYARSKFSDEGIVKIESSSGLFDSVNDSFDRNNLSAEWYEIVFQSEAEIKKNLYAGFYFRVRIMDSYDIQTPIDIYAIPGYGRTFDKSVPALNLFVRYKLNLK